MKDNYICQFVKGKNGQLIGCVVATSRYSVGWSKCNTKAGDSFDKKRALQIALGRAKLNPVIHHTDVPTSLRKVVKYFLNDRCIRYFKSNVEF